MLRKPPALNRVYPSRPRPLPRRQSRSQSLTCRSVSIMCWRWRARRAQHPAVLFFGLALSVTLMAVAANFIARIIGRYHWIAYIGLAVILFVAGRMIYDGIVDHEVGVLQFLF